jgi:dihydrolipoamide dehydrogenase
MPTQLTIIGAGPGGYVAALRAAQLGADVTLIERENVGGTCLNWGCIPSKVLITTAELLERMRRAAEFGLRLEGRIAPDMAALMARKEKVVSAQIKGIEGLLGQKRVRLIKGQAQIEAPGRVSVRTADGTMLEVAWDKLILAVGTAPATIASLPFDGEKIISSNEALGFKEVPESLVIVGGGVIGCEFACLMSALGAKVTLVEALERLVPLPSVDADCSKVLLREMKKRKVTVHLQKSVQAVHLAEDGLNVVLGPSPFGGTSEAIPAAPLSAKKVLVCIGRAPLTRDIGLEKLDVKLDSRGWIEVDGSMRTTAADVYAIGDVLGPQKIMLAHVASVEGRVAAENALGGRLTMDYGAIPGAIFTLPEIANVGLTEAQAVEQGLSVRTASVLFRTLAKAQVLGELAGEAKIVAEESTGRVLGVHLIGAHATDLIGEGTLAVQTGRSVDELARTIHAHPTLTEAMLEVSLKALGQALHG